MKKILVSFFLLLFGSPVSASEVELRPLQVSNQAPLAALCGVPTLDRARLLESGAFETSLRWDLSSNYTTARNDSEQLTFDGETSRLEFRLDRGFSGGWEAGVALPLVAHRRGALDSFIESWHDVWGLPQGGRDSAPDNQLNYSYSAGSGASFSLQDEQSGLGDIRLLLSRQLSLHEGSAIALHLSLELPTGDSDKLSGSGSFDLALWLSGDRAWRRDGQRVTLHWGGGILVADSGDLLAAQRRPVVGTASLGMAWSAWPWMVLQVQLDAHSSLFSNSEFRQIGDASVQLAIGGAVAVSKQTRLELAVVEDIAVDTAPDVTFHVALSHSF